MMLWVACATALALNVQRLFWSADVREAAEEPAITQVYVGFTNEVGVSLHGMTEGNGWTSTAWSVFQAATYSNQWTVHAGSLAYSGVTTNGGHMSCALEGDGVTRHTNTWRGLDEPIYLDGTNVFWIGFLMQPPSGWHRTGNLYLDGPSGSGPSVYLLDWDNDFGATGDLFNAALDLPNSDVQLVLARITTTDTTANERVVCYLSPDLGAATNTWSTFTTWTNWTLDDGGVGPIDRIRLESSRVNAPGAEWFIDEFRIGNTWQEAVGQ